MDSRDKILIVENDPFITRAVETAAASLDLDPVMATDGWDAIEKLETNQYIAVVVDSEAPSGSGYGLLQYIQEEFGEKTLDRVLMITPDDETATRLRRPPLHVLPRNASIDDFASSIRACEPKG
jgi:DNA-binding response OmpR family regulator